MNFELLTSTLNGMQNDGVSVPPVGFSNEDALDASAIQIDNEMKKLFVEEKERNDQLKKYYETLKADYARSQNEVLELQNQLRNLIDENKLMQEKYKAMFEKMQQELKKKQLYIEDLKMKQLDEVELEKLKESLSEQIEAPYKEIVRQLENELQNLKQEYNKVKYENSFLQASIEHDKKENDTLIEQLKLKYELEVNAIRKDRDIMRQKLQESNLIEAGKLKEISKENANLRIKLKALNEENDELREKIEHQETHQNSLIRNQTKTLSDLNTKISALESERESFKHQNDNFYKESLSNAETIANQVRKIHDLERDNQKLRFQIDELKNTNKKDLANIKIDYQNKLNDQNRSKELILNELEDLKTKLEIAGTKLSTQKRQLEDKEREILKSVSSANEENWIKINELTNEKLDLESKLQISQKDYEYKISLLQTDKEKFDEKLRNMEKHREELYKENSRLKAVLNDAENYRILLEKEQEKNRELNKKYHKLEIDASTNTGIEQELTESNLKLRNELNFYMNEIQKSKEHLNRMKDEYENRLQDMKSQYIAEKNEYQLRYNEVQAKYDKMNAKMTEVLKVHEKRKKKYQEAFAKIKTKTELLNAKIKEFKIKEQVLKDSVPLEVHNKVKSQLNSILRRHQEFKDMLTVYQVGDSSTSHISHKVQRTIPSEPSVRLIEI